MFHSKNNRSIGRLRKLIALAASFFLIFVMVGYMTSVPSSSRLSSNMISRWTSDIDSSVFLNLLGMENRTLMLHYDEHNQLHTLSKSLFQLVTSIKPYDFRSLLGNELPGFSRYDREILIAGEGTDYSNLPVESTFPLEDVLEDRQAVYEENDKTDTEAKEPALKETEDLQESVFIYNTHNREAFLPHLPDITDPDLAHHGEINITKVSERLKEELAKNGIGSVVDDTDIIGEVLVEKGWEYWQSYRASRDVVSEAFSQYGDLKYAFDIHRDSMPRDVTTKEINGEPYARIMFVIGEDNPSFQKNFELAESLHKKLEEKYPGLSRGVIPQGGAANNGVYNQDLSENLLLLEVGGVDNTLEETYRTVQALADVFSDHYWDAEAVQGK
ncbi:stage II sporulation protein P [Oceanobacillus alkalisoli]|uniref:stage II sporulation protein P n=1 Tax=Oceanobacillus alkalisoli TaxID=2925113 RepID=UPI001EE3E6BF|nr:stage II sporulation protein P [Oceanobacillus alkalisoli]MCG5103100.1 stage II sporulation protein P [Oceanobacillus alkalisoli]